MTVKKFRLTAEQMVPGLAPTVACIASDRITVDGHHVGYMYRDAFGWTFVAGDEDQAYLDDPDHLGVLSLNELANFDRAILPYLNAPLGSAFVRQGDAFAADPSGAPGEDRQPSSMLNPDFPVVTRCHELSPTWVVTVPEPLNGRLENGAAILWRPGLTARLMVWSTDNGDSRTQRLERLKTHASPSAYDHKRWSSNDALYWTYRLTERADDGRLPALYGYVVADASHVQLALYFDHADDLVSAKALMRGIVPQ